MDEKREGERERWVEGWKDEWKDGEMVNGWMDGWMVYGWMDGVWMDDGWWIDHLKQVPSGGDSSHSAHI